MSITRAILLVSLLAVSQIGAWFYKGLAGIYPDSEHPGFKQINLKPYFPDGLDEFTGRHISPYGEIVSGWTCMEGEKLELQVGTYTFICKRL